MTFKCEVLRAVSRRQQLVGMHSTRQCRLAIDVRMQPNKPLLQSPHTLKDGRRGLRHGGLYGVRRSRTARR